jgi:hypothetical protein
LKIVHLLFDMKKAFIYIILLFLFSSCNTVTFLYDSYNEEKLVTDFMNLWIEKPHEKEERKAFISPEYCKKNGIELKEYKVKAYLPAGFIIREYYPKENVVFTEIWGENLSWTHYLFFKVVKEKGSYYFWPGGYSDNYITPWFKSKLYIKKEHSTEN